MGSLRSALVLVGLTALLLNGCKSAPEPAKPVPYGQLGTKKVPAFMKGTIYELADLSNSESFPVSGYGLVVNLRGTGNSNAPSAVRDYMFKEMARHGIGRHQIPGYENLQPEEMLRDPRVAIVRVDGFIPPGARKDQRFDVQVSALPQSYTSSLSHGQLFQTDLRINGANDVNPGGSVNVWARVWGPVFVNPAYALNTAVTQPSQKASLRFGIVMDGGIVTQDMPLHLRLRSPQFSLARSIEQRIDDRFQTIADMPKKSERNPMGAAAAQNDGVVNLYVPTVFRGNWEHFAKLSTHLYLNTAPEFQIAMARKLAEEAVKPDAPLDDISYCWEGLGEIALPHILPLLTHSSPEVQFAAARAAACIGDASQSAQTALMTIASTANHPFQVSAVQVLGSLPNTLAVNGMLRKLLTVEQTSVRLEAYRILAQNHDPAIFTRVVRESFALDIVPAGGSPLVYASRQGLPRIALLGGKVSLASPFTLLTMENRLSISTNPADQSVALFYRDKYLPEPVTATSSRDLVEIIRRLGGESPAGKPRFDLSYSDVVAILMALHEKQKLVAESAPQPTAAPFVLQELPDVQNSIYDAPVIPDVSRPQAGPTDAVKETIPTTSQGEDTGKKTAESISATQDKKD